jgi:DNA repair exonuclease SbcCD nuclease subunit
LTDGDVARQLRLASRYALEGLTRLVVDEGAQALLLAGDIYDGDWTDYATGQFFATQMGVLADHDIPVFLVSGNHDAESQITRSLRLPSNVRVLSTQKPETVVHPDLGLAVHGQGFASRDVTTNLVLAYPHRVPGLVNVGLLHTAVAGAEGHANYAPCSPEDLARTDYDYFALGHVHQHQIVNDAPRVAAFSGNLQGRHPKETGPKGALVVDVEPDQPATLRHVPLDVARWAAVDVDATGAASIEDVLDRVETRLRDARAEAGSRLLVVRLTVSGTTRAAGQLADHERLQAEVATVADRLGVTVERARSTARRPQEASGVDPELLAAVSHAARQLAADPDQLAELARPLQREFGRPLRGLVDLYDPATLAALAAQAGDELVTRLGG